MSPIPRRVVTGHDERGVSVFAADGPVPVARTAPDGATFYEIWSTDAMPAPLSSAASDPTLPDPTLRTLSVPPPPNGTKIRINEFPPGVASPVHRTQSVDYGIVLDGEVVLVLDDAETTLRTGDGIGLVREHHDLRPAELAHNDRPHDTTPLRTCRQVLHIT